jgi:hypothetical protein
MYATFTVDYWDIVQRSLRVVFRHKFLWFFGFFLAGGGGGGVGNWGKELGPEAHRWIANHVQLLTLLVVCGVILWLALVVMSLISKGALIGGISESDQGRQITFGGQWNVGVRNALKILGIAVLSVVTVLVVLIVLAIPILIPLAAGKVGIVIAIVIGAVLFFPFIAFLFALAFTITYAEREVVLRGVDVFAGLHAGWEMTKRYIGKSLMMWLVSLLSSMMFAVGLGLALLVLAIPFVLIGMANLVLGLALGIPVVLAVIFVLSGAFATYEYSLWTLLYNELRADFDASREEPVAIT